MTVLLIRNDREYLCAPGDELQTDLGVLTVPDDVSPGDTLETHLGEEFTVRRPRGPDFFHHFTRTGSPMLPRDIGLLIGHMGIESADSVLDVGTGTGVLAAYLGRIGASVVTYEKNSEFARVAEENLELAGVSDSVEVRARDVRESLGDLAGFDAMTLDFGDPTAVIRHARQILVPGGTAAVYSPFVEDARATVGAASDVNLTGIETVETIQRAMEFDTRGSRPSTKGVGHTGYLTFARH